MGRTDPLGLLAAHPDDFVIEVAILNKAIEMEKKRRSAEMKATVEGIGVVVRNGFAEVMSKIRF